MVDNNRLLGYGPRGLATWLISDVGTPTLLKALHCVLNVFLCAVSSGGGCSQTHKFDVLHHQHRHWTQWWNVKNAINDNFHSVLHNSLVYIAGNKMCSCF